MTVLSRETFFLIITLSCWLCYSKVIQSIRLTGGPTENVGRVEVLVNGIWGTVCDDSWDIIDATVVCRQLGYPGAVRARSSALFGEGSGEGYGEGSGGGSGEGSVMIWLDNVACKKSSVSLQDCLKNDIGDINCDHGEDAAVECLPLEAASTVTPGIARIRLAGGSTPNAGRVEVYVNGEWGTVCDDSWDIIDAHVVCNQLGYPGAVRAESSAHYGEGSGRIWLDNVACAVSSLSLQDCPKSEIGDHNCNHKEDAGVECLPLDVPTTVAPGIARIRLAGGSIPNAGRVEVFVNGEWGTVCDDSWDITDAHVVCRQLGYPGAVRAELSAHYGEGSGRIWLDDVACAVSSLSLQDCLKSEIGDHNCDHKEDAGVECLPLEVPTTVAPGIASIRLAGGGSPNSGRVEVFVNGEWGTVCDDSWGITDAHVVCNQLGYPGAVRATSKAYYGEGSGRIWLDDVACGVSSLSLQDCPKSEIGDHNCNHKEDAGVECLPLEVPTTVAPGIASIRLAGGSSPNAGRVEVFVNGEWGTVCDDSWDITDAFVVCNQLGYPGAVRATSKAYYGEGSGRIWLDNVACAESSLSLQDCPKSEIGDHNCNHKEDAGVECLPLDVPTSVASGIASIRLAGGSSPNAGRVEVFVNGEWGTVCDHSWDITDANVVCRQLGYPGAVRARSSAHFGRGSGRIWLDDVACADSSLSLQDCPMSEIGVHNCNHKEDAGVKCLPLEVPTTVAPGIESIRLVDGSTPNAGRVEVFVNGEWGTVCDHSWDITDANVVCRQLGYPGAVRARSSAHFGRGSGRIWLDDVACADSSLSLQDCPMSEIGVHNCNHKEDAGVKCLPLEVPTTVAPGIASIRLVDGSTPNAGRVEVFVNGEWGTVCDHSWDITDAHVVCRQLGYPGAVRARSSAHYGEGSGRIWLDDVACADSSLSLQDCPMSEIGVHNCNHKEDAGVKCLPLEVPTTVAPGIASIRLVGGSSPNAGRVEVFVNGEWGTVCDNSWDINDAAVVCRQLGYPGAVRATSKAHYGEGSGRIWLDNVACGVSSLSLQDCPKSEIGDHNCNHKEDAGVECLPLEVPTTVAPVSPETLQFVVAPTDVTVEEGDVVQLFCEVNNEAASRFWFKGMSQISSEDSEESVHVTIDGNLIFVNTEVGFTGRYTCLARSPSGQEARASAFLTVTALHTATNVPSRQLYFLKRPEDTELALGDIVVFHCEVDDASAEITWFKDDIQIAQGLINGLVLLRDNSLIITDIEVHHHGTYKCVATSSDSRRAEVTARAYFPTSYVFDSKPGDATVFDGENHILTCSSSIATLQLSWLKDGSPLVYNQRTIEIVDRVLLRDVTADDSGLYVCVAADSEGHVVAQARAAVDVLPHTLNNDDCGIVSSPEVLEDANTRGVHSGRVVGGRDAGRGSAPWMARLFLREGLHGRGGFVCGGSLIDRQWVVTAAHCFNIIENLSARQLYVILGDHDTLATEDSQIYVLVEAFYLHEEYDINTFNNDIALIKLATPLQRYSSYVRPICLANRTIDRELLVVGVSGRVSGWGATTEGGAPSLYLQEVQIPFIPYPTCKVNFRPKYVFTKNMFCAGYERGGADACQGDSGGPYAVEKASRWFLMGIVSWGIGCGRHGSYGAYTRYSKYHQWVKRVITSY
ncbi:scavenger receptor cysteine-rich type 1 protein M130-like isoform X3 [Apostichopus japonicus]|uniref:scavenger receptor cysteine-rich type 1 protein M130-like isoform X3 n=1 Tax=Stichopus japonicus TaxID=307972 RepID=UPI003AB1AE44